MSLKENTPISANSFNELYQQVKAELKRREQYMGSEFFRYRLDDNFVAQEGQPIAQATKDLINAVLQINDIKDSTYLSSNIHQGDGVVVNEDPNVSKLIQLQTIKEQFNEDFTCRGGCVGLCLGSCLGACSGTNTVVQ